MNDHETFGNEFIRVNFLITTNKVFDDLPNEESTTKELATEDLTAYFVWPIASNNNRFEIGHRQRLMRIVEFGLAYQSQSTFVMHHFESVLNDPSVSLNIASIEFWPTFNYARWHLSQDKSELARYWYYNSLFSRFESDVLLHHRLHEHAVNSRTIYKKAKKAFLITDLEIVKKFQIDRIIVRDWMLEHDIPILIKGTKIIDKVTFHAPLLWWALNQYLEARELQKSYQYEANVWNVQALMKYLETLCSRHNLNSPLEQDLRINSSKNILFKKET